MIGTSNTENLEMSMLNLNTLNPQQRVAVEQIKGPVLLLAGAGTGKTRVITYRIAYMLEKKVDPEKVVALTFTNKAAREMKERVTTLCGERGQSLFVGTFHSFCIRLLRKYAKKIGLPSRFVLLGSSDQVDLVTKALEIKNLEGMYRPQEIHARISDLKNKLIDPEGIDKLAQAQVAPEEAEILKTIYELYEEQLRLNHALDFDDCIFKVVKMLQKHEDIKSEIQASFTHFLVDEFQDTNFSQLTLLRELVNVDNNVCVVGDDDQSIYSWRGAMYETLEKFEVLFPKTKLIKLEQNYRCTSLILDAANKVIKNNTKRKDKTLWSDNKNNHPIIVKECGDEADEAQWVAKQIIGLLGRGLKPQDIAILYRANALARAFEISLRENRIPYKVYGGQSFFEKREIKDFIGYLRIVNNPNDRLAFWRVVNTPNRGIGLKSLAQIDSVANQQKCSPLKALRSCVGDLPSSAQSGANEFLEILDTFQKRQVTTPEDLEVYCKDLLKSSKLVGYHQKKTKQLSSGLKKAETLNNVPRWLRNSAEALEGDTLSIESIIEAVTLSNDDKKKDENPDHVSLLTIHAAKGLEFKRVFIVGTEDDLLPHKNSVAELNGLAEERRLFYVALTRAKEQLYMSHCRLRATGHQSQAKLPSRFFSEIPEELLSDEGSASKDFEKVMDSKREKTKSRLTDLMSSL